MTGKPKRRWYQYSLRSLFILTTLVAIACSWYANEMQQAAKRRAAIEEIEKLGGEVWYYDAKATRAPGEPPRWLSWLRRLHSEEHLGNATLVSLMDTKITDAGMANLQGLTNVEELFLAGTRITDAGLVHLEDLTNLEELELSGTQITDAGLMHLKGLIKLDTLFLEETQISDAGLVHLKSLTNLEGLELSNTQVTDEGVSKLKDALPDCLISH